VHRELQGIVRWVNISLIVIGLVASVIYLFNIAIAGQVMLERAYIGLILVCFLPGVFLSFPASSKSRSDTLPWYDLLAAFLCILLPIAVFFYALPIDEQGWVIIPPVPFIVFAAIQWILLIEVSRRAAGTFLACTVALFSIYPLLASLAPGFLKTGDVPLIKYIGFQFLGDQGEFGIIMKVVARLILGFMAFGVVLNATGAGKFFLDLALALFGRIRGGTAKVALVSSSMLASLTGSVVSNIVTTGNITIPAMKKTGYDPETAAAVEAVASTGGQITPPVMGAAAFLIAAFLGVPYAKVCIAAAAPALIFFTSLYFHIDSYAARNGIKGMPRSECPSLRETLTHGWFYIFAVVLLVWFIFVLRVEARAPYWASAFLLVAAMFRKETRLNLQKSTVMIEGVGRTFSGLVGIVAPLGLVIGSLNVTGSGIAFASELKAIGAGSIPLLLILSAVASYILGMGLTVTACYVFLATVICPALTSLGLNLLASHMFVFYLGLSSFITPPVALGSYAAAAIANASPLRTGFRSLKLGIIMLILPFMFILNPALLLEGTITEFVRAFSLGIVGVALIAAGVEGYLLRLGVLNAPQRFILIASGLLFLYPHLNANLLALFLLLVAIFIRYVLLLSRKNITGSADET